MIQQSTKPHIVCTIQARMGSSRLPGKTLATVVGKPVLELMVERLKRATTINEIVVATTVNSEDDAIEALCHKLDISCYRGSSERVLERVVQALQVTNADINVELMADSPFPEPTIVDAMVGIYFEHRYDYVSNCITTTFPPGLEARVYPRWVLEDALQKAETDDEQEHVALNVYSRPDRYKMLNVLAPDEWYAPELYLEMDTAEDLKLVTSIYEALYPANPGFTLDDILAYARANPDIGDLNRAVPRRWKEIIGGELTPGIETLQTPHP